MKSFLSKHLVVFSLSLTLAACSITPSHLFSDYSTEHAEAHRALQTGNVGAALEALPSGSEPILDQFERGRIHYLANQYSDSFAALKQADSAVKEQQQQAIIQLSDGASQVGSLITNDNVIEYLPGDYELGFLHLYLALNYLQQRDLDSALVEVRRANLVQEQARKIRESDLQEAEDQAKQNQLNQQNIAAVLARYPDAGDQLANVQNGYLFYLSGLLYEMAGEYNDAYIDYKRALAVAPDNQFVAQSVLRLAQQLSMNEDLAVYRQRYGAPERLEMGNGRVVIIDEQAVVNALATWRLPILLSDSRGYGALHQLTLPYYRRQPSDTMTPLKLGQQPIAGSRLVNVNAMAQQNLNEKISGIVIRQALRVVAKNELRQQAAKNGNDIGNVVMNLVNVLTDQADTRSWQSLPASVELYQADLKAGKHQLHWGVEQLDFDVVAGKTTLVWVSRQAGQWSAWATLMGSAR